MASLARVPFVAVSALSWGTTVLGLVSGLSAAIGELKTPISCPSGKLHCRSTATVHKLHLQYRGFRKLRPAFLDGDGDSVSLVGAESFGVFDADIRTAGYRHGVTRDLPLRKNNDRQENRKANDGPFRARFVLRPAFSWPLLVLGYACLLCGYRLLWWWWLAKTPTGFFVRVGAGCVL